MRAIVLSRAVAMAALVFVTAAGAQTWNCGFSYNDTPTPTVKATLSGGTLTVSGSGNMASATPWRNSQNSITKVVIEDGVTSIGNSAFLQCYNLTSVNISNSVTSIDGSAFYNCTSLTSVTIPNSVTSIEWGAFGGTGLTSVTIPNSVTSIRENSFSSCRDLTNIEVGDGNTTYSSVGGVLFDISKTILHTYPAGKQDALYSIPNSVTSINEGAFSGCVGLTSVTIPNSVTFIGRFAFSSCTGLTSVTIPNSVMYLREGAFNGCSNLTYVAIPNSVTEIEYGIFWSCSSLTSVEIPNSVTTINGSAFTNAGLTSVTIPNSVDSIGYGAFIGCANLTEIEVGSGNTAYSSVDGVLFNKAQDTLLAYPGGKQGAYIIPDGVIYIGHGAFEGHTSLTSVTIPNSMTTIREGAFRECSGLTSVTIPNSVDSIGSYAFDRCTSIESVTIPNSVKFIGEWAFWLSGLTSVICLGAVPPSANANTFYDIPSSVCLFVPEANIENYRSADGWKYFGYINPSDVTFDSKGGSFVGNYKDYFTGGKISYGENLTKPNDPTRDGYDFDGWYKDAAYTTPWNFATDVVTSDVTLYAKWVETDENVSVLTPTRVVPPSQPSEEATVIAPAVILSGEFTAGPNPISKQSGIVNFYRQGRRVTACELYIYDATGNIINKVKISDNALNNQSRRIAGKWDLTDRKGRQVSEGTYLVKGVLKTSDGKSEKVSVIVGVR